MKTERYAMQFRKSIWSLAIVSGLALTVFSCKKDEEETKTITVQEMAEVVSQAIASDGGGMVVQGYQGLALVVAAQGERKAGKTTDNCGIPHTTSVVGKNSDTATVYTYSYSYAWSYATSCVESTVTGYTLTAGGKSVYEGPRVSSSDSVTTSMNVSGLPEDSAFYQLSETYIREGNQVSKFNSKKSFKSKITIVSSNMKVKKGTTIIASGTATIKITGEVVNGDTFSKSGTFTFSGNEAGSLILDGDKYTVSWIKE